MSKETSIAEHESAPPEVDLDVEDVPVALDEENYDFGAMVAGVRATRKRVRIRPNAHLLADLEEMVERIDAATDDEAADLAEEYYEKRAAYDRTFPVVIEARSSDWTKNFTKDMKAKGINPSRKGLSEDESTDHLKKLLCAQIAAQIVYPTKGVTAEAITALVAASEAEADKLFRAMRAVNTQPSGESPDFSPRPSGTRRSG